MNRADRWSADQALEELYAVHWRQLVRLAVLLVRDVGTAEEVVQDAFVAMHGRWGRLRDNDSALASAAETAPSSDGRALDADRRSTVLHALGTLPDRQREVLVLRHYLDLSEAEIADALGIARGSVKSHASRGSAALRDVLGDLWKDES